MKLGAPAPRPALVLIGFALGVGTAGLLWTDVARPGFAIGVACCLIALLIEFVGTRRARNNGEEQT